MKDMFAEMLFTVMCLSRYLNIYVGMPDVEEGFNITKPISPHEVSAESAWLNQTRGPPTC